MVTNEVLNTILSRKGVKQYKSNPVPVSYTHLDVYKRQVLAHNGIHAIKDTRFNIVFRTVAGLLRSLENQFDVALQFVFRLHQHLCRTEKHGDMAVMAAGMHDALISACKGQACLFLYRQGINIRPESHSSARLFGLSLIHICTCGGFWTGGIVAWKT